MGIACSLDKVKVSATTATLVLGMILACMLDLAGKVKKPCSVNTVC